MRVGAFGRIASWALRLTLVPAGCTEPPRTTLSLPWSLSSAVPLCMIRRTRTAATTRWRFTSCCWGARCLAGWLFVLVKTFPWAKGRSVLNFGLASKQDGFKYSASDLSYYSTWCWEKDGAAASAGSSTWDAALRAIRPAFFNSPEGEMCLADRDFDLGSAADLVNPTKYWESEVGMCQTKKWG